MCYHLEEKDSLKIVKGKTSWGFGRFLVQTILKLVLGNLSMYNIIFELLKEYTTLILKERNTAIKSIFWAETTWKV